MFFWLQCLVLFMPYQWHYAKILNLSFTFCNLLVHISLNDSEDLHQKYGAKRLYDPKFKC